MTSTEHTRVAVVTGASSGIGAATARALAADGYRLALLARRVDRVTALAAGLGQDALAIEADVTDQDSLVAAADRVHHELGGADVLVNNAGIMLLGPFSADRREDCRRMVEVNLLGAITATEVFLDQLTDGGGDIVNVSSAAGRTARAGNGVYAATKWGLNGWSEALRVTVASPAPSPPSCPATSPTPRPGPVPKSSTARSRSPPRTSRESSRSRSAGPGAWPSTRSSSVPPARRSDEASP